MGIQQFNEYQPINSGLPLDNATGTAWQTFVEAQLFNQRVDGIWAINYDAIDHVIEFRMSFGFGPVVYVGVNIPSSPLAGVTLVTDCLAPMFPLGVPNLILKPSEFVEVRPASVIVANMIYVRYNSALVQ